MEVFNNDQYMAYLESLASLNKAIAHSDLESHFAELIISNQPFPQTYLHNFINSLRSSLNFPCLLAESFEVEYAESRKDFLGAFLILDKVLPDDIAEIREKITKCEGIAQQFLERMDFDFNHADPVTAFFNMGSVSIEKIGPVTKEFVGVRVDFKYSKPEYFNYNADNWN